MEDSFFGFDLGLPRRVAKDNSDELQAGTEDEEIDLLNDETFGDCDGGWEFGQNEIYLDQSSEVARRYEEEQEEFLAQNISQLVVDDDDDDDDDVTGRTKSESQPIPNKHTTNLDDLFGPSSPPAFLDTEHLVSPTTKNIWRPPNENTPRAGSLPLPSNLIENKPNPPLDDPAVVCTGKPINGNQFPSPRDGDISREDTRPSPIQKLLQHAAIKQQQSAGRISPGQGHRTPNAQGRLTPTNQGHVIHSPMMGVPPGVRPPQSASPLVLVQSPSLRGNTISPPPHNNSPAGPVLLPHNVVTNLYPHLLRSPYVKPVPGGFAVDPRVLPNMHGNGANGRVSPSTPTYPFLANTPLGPRIPLRMPNTDPTHQRPRPHMPYPGGFRHPFPGRGSVPPRGPPPHHGINYHHHDPTRQHLNYDNYSGGEPFFQPSDPYANLMTQKEKDWIIKIQLLQLQTDNPYLDDYYYTTFMLKKLEMERKKKQEQGIVQGDNKELRLLLPDIAKVDRTYTPAQFEGSLGKVTASSVHNPRHIIDAKISAGRGEDDKTKDRQKLRQLLMNIEKMYDILLNVDDIEKQLLTKPEEQRKAMYENRTNKIGRLYELLVCNSSNIDTFVYCMYQRKGKLLIKRALPLFDKFQSHVVLSLILKHLPSIVRKDQNDEYLPGMYPNTIHVINTSDMDNLVDYAKILMEEHPTQANTKILTVALQNKFGVSVLCTMISRVEYIYVNSPLDVDNNYQNQWSQFLVVLGETLCGMTSDKQLAKPLSLFPQLASHLERVLESKVLLQIDERLQYLMGITA